MAEQSDSPDSLAARIAARQHGVASIQQLRRSGLSDDAVLRRSRCGWLHRIHRGVYAVGHSGVSQEGKWMAAVLALGGGPRTEQRTVLGQWGAALSHRAAAGLWGLLPAGSGPIDVSIPSQGGRRSRQGIRMHRCVSLLPASVTLHDAIPVTTPERTISDLRRAASRSVSAIAWSDVRRAMRQADVLGLPVGIEASPDRTRSELEYLFLRLCRDHALPPPEVNVRLGTLEVDFLWRDQHLIVETDGYRYHRGRTAFEEDRGRELELRALGYDVLRFTYRQVTSESRRVATALRRRL